jgi:hypothetical protein
LLALVLGASPQPGIAEQTAKQLSQLPSVRKVFPKLRFAFPCSARGGAELFGQDLGTSEMIGDGVEPALVQGDVKAPWKFEDPFEAPGPSCMGDSDCTQPAYCERNTEAPAGKCVEPVPALVSQYLVEIFNRGIAPAHGLPPVGESILSRTQGLTFSIRLGESILGRGRHGTPRTVRARIVGVSPRAIDLGITLPLNTVRRWNREFAGEGAASSYSSLLVESGSASGTARVIAASARLGLVPHDTRARDISVLVDGVMALLTLVALVILVVSASNIAYTFRSLLQERRGEIGLYRAVGATRLDVLLWLMTLAAVVGVIGGVSGVVLGRVAALAADTVAASRLPDFPFKPDSFFAFPAWLVLGSVLFGALFSVIGAAGPARRAAKIDPRENLQN